MKKNLTLLATAILLASSVLPPQTTIAASPAPTPQILSLAGFVPSAMTALAVQGDYAYIAAGNALVVFQVSDPDHPQQVAFLFLRSPAQKIRLSGPRLAVLGEDRRVYLFDLHLPASPALAGEYAQSAEIYDLALEGDFLFLGMENGMQVVDTTSLSDPQVAVDWPVGLPVSSLAVREDTAYLGIVTRDVPGSGLLWVVNVANPRRPRKLGETEPVSGVWISNLALDQSILAAVGEDTNSYSCTLFLFDVSRPENLLSLAQSFIGNGKKPQIALDNRRVYSAVQDGALQTLDSPNLSNPISPTNETVWGVQASQGLVYVAGGANGFSIYDASDPTKLVQRARVPVLGNAFDVAASGAMAYIADLGVPATFYDRLHGGLAVIDASAQVIGKSSDWRLQSGSRVAVDGKTAYLSGGYCQLRYTSCKRGLYSLDIALPNAPQSLGFLDIESWSARSIPLLGIVTVEDNLALVADPYSGLNLNDVTQPAKPVLDGRYRLGSPDGPYGEVSAATVQGKYAYVTVQHVSVQKPEGLLSVIDISSPASPTQVNSFPLDDPHDITLLGSFAYIADGYTGLKILDLSQAPQTINQASALSLPGTAERVALGEGPVIYIAAGEAGVRMIDISDPAHPVEVSAYDTAGYANGVAVAGGRIYVADEMGGLLTFNTLPIRAYFPLVSR